MGFFWGFIAALFTRLVLVRKQIWQTASAKSASSPGGVGRLQRMYLHIVFKSIYSPGGVGRLRRMYLHIVLHCCIVFHPQGHGVLFQVCVGFLRGESTDERSDVQWA
jgi:hypothetical protein